MSDDILTAEELGAQLDPRHLTFAEEYLRTWNATTAARTAKYTHPGQQGERMLKRSDVSAYIQARLRESAVSADEVLARLSEQVRVNISDFVDLDTEPVVDKDGKVLGERQVVNLNWEMIKRKGYLIKSITNTKSGPKIELYDAQSANIWIGKHHKLFADDSTPVSVNLTLSSDDMARAREKAQQHEASLLNSDG